MSTPISSQRAQELLQYKQSRAKKGKPAEPLPVKKFPALHVIYNRNDDLWEVKEGWKVLFSGTTERECREERDRLENERI